MTLKKHSGIWSQEDNQPVPEPPYVNKILLDLWEGMFPLVAGGLVLWLLINVTVMAGYVFLLLGMAVAVFVVAPTLAGLMASCAKSARGGFLRIGDAVRGIFHLYWRSVALALPLVILVGIITITVQIVTAYPDRQEMVFSLALQVGVTLTVVLAHIYLYPVLALYDTSVKKAVLLAGALAAKFVWQTIVLALLGGALLALGSLHPLVPIFVIGPWCVIAANTTWRLAQRILPPLAGIDK